MRDILLLLFLVLRARAQTSCDVGSTGVSPAGCSLCAVNFFKGDTSINPCLPCGFSSTTFTIGSSSYTNCLAAPMPPLSPFFPGELSLSDFYHNKIFTYWRQGNQTRLLDSGEIELNKDFVLINPITLPPIWQITYSFNITTKTTSVVPNDSISFVMSTKSASSSAEGLDVVPSGQVFTIMADTFNNSISSQNCPRQALTITLISRDSENISCWSCVDRFENGLWNVRAMYNTTAKNLSYMIVRGFYYAPKLIIGY